GPIETRVPKRHNQEIGTGVSARAPAESTPIEPDLDHTSEGRDRPLTTTEPTSASATRPRRELPRVAVIGAGVSGLGIGWRLATAGCAITVFERGAVGRGASWAAAGMLAAGLEAEPGEERLLALNLEAQRLWPAFRAELEAASGSSIDYRDEG